MKSYALAIALSMLLSAIYAIQNTQEITVRFLFFEGAYAQGLWEVILFSAGAVLMWFFSLLALLEVRSKYRGQIRERDKKIASLEEEINSLLLAFRGSGRELNQDRPESSDSADQSAPSLHQEEGETV